MSIFNKYTLIGIVLIIIGIPLSVIWIGIPLMILGFLIGDFGIIYGIVKKVPGLEDKSKKVLKTVKDSYKPYFRKKVIRK
jgi:hypothetical protein